MASWVVPAIGGQQEREVNVLLYSTLVRLSPNFQFWTLQDKKDIKVLELIQQGKMNVAKALE